MIGGMTGFSYQSFCKTGVFKKVHFVADWFCNMVLLASDRFVIPGISI
jgi:hypothetical protein